MKSFINIFSELSLIFFYPISSLFAQIVGRNELEGKGDGKVIVIVERWLSKNVKHIFWKHYLEKRGYKVYLANFSLYKGSFANSALDLKKYIEKRDLEDIILVGISSGGLTSLIYLQDHGGWERVDKFISVGAPFKGTWTALTLTLFYSGRQLLPNSSFIKKIKKYEIKNLDRIYCFRTTIDEMVPYGSVLSGAHEMRINAIGHNNLHLGIGRTYERIAELGKTSP